MLIIHTIAELQSGVCSEGRTRIAVGSVKGTLLGQVRETDVEVLEIGRGRRGALGRFDGEAMTFRNHHKEDEEMGGV